MGRFIIVALGLGLGFSLSAAGQPAPASLRNTKSPTVSTRLQTYCDPVCELQAQDSAFGFLIEAYRQFQAHEIEVNYQSRLKAAAQLGQEPDSLVIGTELNSVKTLRTWIEVLAEKERDLRLEQLQTRIANFKTAYHCTRKAEEISVGQPVASKLDPRLAARELTTLRLLDLGSPVNANFQTVTSRPANSIFLDSAPAEAWADQLVGPCEDETVPPLLSGEAH
jgi:hypothetical protein